MKVIYVDIDETICRRETSIDFGTTHDYTKAKPIVENIEKINKLYNEGNTIVYWTARGSRKQKDWTDLTKRQLDSWGAKYHELRTDKPFYDLFIEDKSLRIEEL
jgi:histidinol phosphatase-like enzyme